MLESLNFHFLLENVSTCRDEIITLTYLLEEGFFLGLCVSIWLIKLSEMFYFSKVGIMYSLL